MNPKYKSPKVSLIVDEGANALRLPTAIETNRHRNTNPGIRCLNHVFQTFEPRTMMQWILIQTCSNAKAKNHAHQSNAMNSYTSGIYLHRVWKIVIFLSDTFIIRYLVRGPNLSIPGLVFPWRAEPTVFLWRLATWVGMRFWSICHLVRNLVCTWFELGLKPSFWF